jgi:ribosomal protein L37AE/L43A
MKKIIYEIKKGNAKFHLEYKCPTCPKKKRQSRDILKQGDCFWYTNWKNGKYDLKSYYAYKLLKKLGKLLRQIRVVQI